MNLLMEMQQITKEAKDKQYERYLQKCLSKYESRIRSHASCGKSSLHVKDFNRKIDRVWSDLNQQGITVYGQLGNKDGSYSYSKWNGKGSFHNWVDKNDGYSWEVKLSWE